MTLREFHVRAARVCVALASLLVAGIQVNAAGSADLQLIMVEEAGCRFCQRWDADVGGVYATSPEGRVAPLKRVKREAAELAKLKPAVYTPTFILVRGEQEIGRISGYPGESFFWEELGELFKFAGVDVEAMAAKP